MEFSRFLIRRRTRHLLSYRDDTSESSEDERVKIRHYRDYARLAQELRDFPFPRTISRAPTYVQDILQPDLPELPPQTSLKPHRLAFRRPGRDFVDEHRRWEAVVSSLESEKILERLQWPALIMQSTVGERWSQLATRVKEAEEEQTTLIGRLAELRDRNKELEDKKLNCQKEKDELVRELSERQRDGFLRQELWQKQTELDLMRLDQEHQQKDRERQADLQRTREAMELLKQRIKEKNLEQRVKELGAQAQKPLQEKREEMAEDQRSGGAGSVGEGEGLKDHTSPETEEAAEENDLRESQEKQHEQQQDSSQRGHDIEGESTKTEGEELRGDEATRTEAQDQTEMSNDLEEMGFHDHKENDIPNPVSPRSQEESPSTVMDEISELERKLEETKEEYDRKFREVTAQEDVERQERRRKKGENRMRWMKAEDEKDQSAHENYLAFRRASREKADTQRRIKETREDLHKTQREKKEGQIRMARLKEVQGRVTERVEDVRKQLESFIPDDKENELKELELEKELHKVLGQELEKAREKVREEVRRENLDDKRLTNENELNDLLRIYSFIPAKLSSQSNIYNSLRENEIRLLVVFPAPNRYFPVICALNTVRLDPDRCPKYAALSYWWGPEEEEIIYVLPNDYSDSNTLDYTGKNLVHLAIRTKVRTNLFCALHRLRRRDRPVMLWVDRLCIDQDNAKEKAQQLDTMMVHIYRCAENVCVWLGEQDADGQSDKAMNFIPKIVDMATLDTCIDDKEQASDWAALTELMRDPWFSRRWVVQEIVLAKNATLHCGEKIVRWTDFVDAIFLLVINEDRVKKLFDFSKWRYGPETLGEIKSSSANVLLEVTNHLFLRNEDGGLRSPSKSLEYLVTSLTTFNASNARDIIYSLVQIAQDTSTSFSTIEGEDASKAAVGRTIGLETDYDKDIAHVYGDFTKFCIESSGSLDIICRHWAVRGDSAKDSNNMKLPSWIPLLEDSEFGEPGEEVRGRKNGESLVGRADRPRYRASEDTIATWDFFSSQVLSAKGFKLASIEDLSPINQAGLILRESLQLLGWPGVDNKDEVPDQVWRTLIANRDFDGQVPPTWYQRVCLRCLEMADTFNNGDLNIGQLLPQASEVLRIYLRRVRSITWNRRFFRDTMTKGKPRGNEAAGVTTDDGNIVLKKSERKPVVGFCPRGTQKGDFVCILFGCSVPLVLRQIGSGDGGQYTLIGECYVHGKMDGEAMVDSENEINFKLE